MTSTDLMNVAAFENQLPDASFASLNPADESLADGIGSSYGIVGYKGKVWTLRLRGETHTFVRPDDGSPQAFLDVIVLRSAAHKSKSYYPAGSFNDDSAGTRPTCSSLDGVNPDSDATTKQASACAICPRNEWKSNAEGRKGRECADFKRLAVLILPSQTKALLGAPLMEPVFLRIPAASLNDLATLGEAMQKKGFHYASYITRVGFQVDKPHPQMTFRALQPLTAKEAPIVLPMREDPQALRITGENEVGKPQPGVQSLQLAGKPSNSTPASQIATASTPAKTSSTPASASSSIAQTTTSPSDEIALLKAKLAAAEAAAKPKTAEPETVSTGFDTTMEIIPPAKTAPVVISNEGLGASQDTVEAGFGDLGPALRAEAKVHMNTADDTGPAEDADDDLNARVAGLLQR